MLRQVVVLTLAAALLAGCGGSKSKSSPKAPAKAAATPDTAGLEVVQPRDLKAFAFNQGPSFVVSSASVYAKSVEHDPSDVANLTRDGFVTARAVRYGSPNGGGYSTASRFRDAAAARTELAESIAPAKGAKLTRSKVPGLPSGLSAVYTGQGYVGRNVYFVRGATLFFAGFSVKRADDPGQAVLVAAAKKAYAQTRG